MALLAHFAKLLADLGELAGLQQRRQNCEIELVPA